MENTISNLYYLPYRFYGYALSDEASLRDLIFTTQQEIREEERGKNGKALIREETGEGVDRDSQSGCSMAHEQFFTLLQWAQSIESIQGARKLKH